MSKISLYNKYRKSLWKFKMVVAVRLIEILTLITVLGIFTAGCLIILICDKIIFVSIIFFRVNVPIFLIYNRYLWNIMFFYSQLFMY